MTIMYAGTGTLFKAVKFGENDGKVCALTAVLVSLGYAV